MLIADFYRVDVPTTTVSLSRDADPALFAVRLAMMILGHAIAAIDCEAHPVVDWFRAQSAGTQGAVPESHLIVADIREHLIPLDAIHPINALCLLLTPKSSTDFFHHSTEWRVASMIEFVVQDVGCVFALPLLFFAP